MAMRSLQKPVVIVTGTSSGIGLALARMLYDSNSCRVVITARESSLAKLRQEFHEKEDFRILSLDITSPVEQRAVIDETLKVFGRIDVLVNNAGISYRAVVEDMEKKDDYHQLHTNYFGPMNLIRLVLPLMRKQRSGRIINVSSVGGMMAMPTMASYSASKFALEGASEALWYEMKPWGIHVTLVQPGFVHSSSFEHVYLTEKYRALDPEHHPYKAYYRNMSRFIAVLMNRALATPESIAAIILRTIWRKHPPLRIPATVDARFFSLLRRLLPRSMYHSLLYCFLPGIKEWGKEEEDISPQGEEEASPDKK